MANWIDDDGGSHVVSMWSRNGRPLPPVRWTPMSIPNPNRRWWQFWKSRRIINPRMWSLFFEDTALLEGIPLRKNDELS